MVTDRPGSKQASASPRNARGPGCKGGLGDSVSSCWPPRSWGSQGARSTGGFPMSADRHRQDGGQDSDGGSAGYVPPATRPICHADPAELSTDREIHRPTGLRRASSRTTSYTASALQMGAPTAPLQLQQLTLSGLILNLPLRADSSGSNFTSLCLHLLACETAIMTGPLRLKPWAEPGTAVVGAE